PGVAHRGHHAGGRHTPARADRAPRGPTRPRRARFAASPQTPRVLIGPAPAPTCWLTRTGPTPSTARPSVRAGRAVPRGRRAPVPGPGTARTLATSPRGRTRR